MLPCPVSLSQSRHPIIPSSRSPLCSTPNQSDSHRLIAIIISSQTFAQLHSTSHLAEAIVSKLQAPRPRSFPDIAWHQLKLGGSRLWPHSSLPPGWRCAAVPLSDLESFLLPSLTPPKSIVSSGHDSHKTSMPFGFKHGNRSKQALNDPPAQVQVQVQVQAQGIQTPSGGGSGSASPIPNPNFSTDELAQRQPSAPFNHQPREGPYAAQTIAPDIDPRSQQQRAGDFPSRSQSTRHHSAYPHQPPSGSSSSTDDLALNSRKQQRQGGAQLPPAAEQKKSKSLFDRMRSSKHSDSKTPPAAQQASYNNTTGLARRLSKRQETPPVLRTNPQRTSLEQQKLDWQSSAQDSRSHLPSPQEGHEDDGGLDPYLIRDSEQSASHSTAREEGHQQHTIRPVQGDSEPLGYSPVDEQHQQFETQQQQHLRDQHLHQHTESGSQNYYHSQSQTQQPKLNISPTSLITGEQYRHQNPETVSQLSYELPDQREEQRPVSVQSNGQSPTSYQGQRQEYPSRTSSVPQGPRPLSQYTMAPPGGASANRRTGDSKTLPPGQGQPESRDGPPPNYSRGQFSGTQAPAPAMNTLPAGSAQGPGYRGGPPQREYSSTGGGEQGRSTPPPAPGERDVTEMYKELSESSHETD